MTISIDKSAAGSVIATAIGIFPIASLNNWNNTAFSQLCMSKSDDELFSLAKNDKLDPIKQTIAHEKLSQRCQDQI